MKYLIKYFLDFTVLVFLYAFVFFRKWRSQGRDSLLVNTLMYAYLSLVLYFTMMPVVASIPFVLDHPYKPMNMVPFIDVSLRRGNFFRQVFLNVIMTLPFGFLFPLTRDKRAKFGVTVLRVWQDTASYRCRSCRMLKDGFPILQAMQDRKTFMPPTAPPIMNFGTISQGRASRNLSEAAQGENVLKQGN